MQKDKDKFLEKMHAYLFSGKEEQLVEFSADQQEMVIRYRAICTKWMDEPMLSDSMMVRFITNQFEIGESQAYKDLGRIRILLGNVQNAAKEFQRYRATEMILKGYEKASEADTQMEIKQAQIMIKAGEALGKIYMLDKNEMDRIPREDIVPLELEPTTDISVLGRKPLKNLESLKARLRKKYGSATDVPFEEINESEEMDGDGEEESVL